jgi:hypothetical protein
MGVVVANIHRAISFKQAPFFAPYISYNTSKRAATNSSIGKMYYKLKNNALFGKTIENERKRKNIRITNTKKKLKTYTSKPTFKRTTLIDKDLVLVHLMKECTELRRPIYIGQAVLDISKLRMYQLYYDQLKGYANSFKGEINIIGGDTDSFFLEIKGIPRNPLLKMMKNDNLLDTSNYPTNHPLYSVAHTAEIGLVKDETAGDPILDWVLLRPKCYSYITEKGKGDKKAKGVQKFAVKKQLTHKHYRNVYENSFQLSLVQAGFVSKNHSLYTYSSSKTALSPMDDKRVWIAKNLSLAYGHFTL